MTDPSLDMSIDALAPEPEDVIATADPWLARRMLGFGASDVPALLVGLGRRDASAVTGHIAANAKVKVWRKGHAAMPRIVAEKAGLRRPLAHGGGGERERELFHAWAATLPADGPIDRASVTHASVVPRALHSPIRDVLCPGLAVSLDGWAYRADPLGLGSDRIADLVIVEAKCADVLAMKSASEAYQTDGACPWWWRTQVQAQLAATGAPLGLLVCGHGWAYRTGPIEVWSIERDEAEIAEIRLAVCEAMAMVADAKAKEAKT